MTKSRKKCFVCLLCVLLCAGAALCCALRSTFTFKITPYEVYSPRLPAAFEGYKIVQISDLHGAEFGEGNGKLLAAVKAEKPDIIVITGDLADPNKTEAAYAFTAGAVTLAPCYFVTGNHEANFPGIYEQTASILPAQGVTMLHNETVPLKRGGDTLWLTGMDDPLTAGADLSEREAYYTQTLRPVTAKDGYHILLSHRPEYMEYYAGAGVDLVFTGHAHGGQLRLPFIGAVYAPNQGFFPAYDGGIYRQNTTVMVESLGLGCSVIPFRLCCTPEVVTVTLHRGSEP